MSFEAWHPPSKRGPLCAVCGEPLRLDDPKPHVCSERREQPARRAMSEGVKNLLLVLLMIAVGLLAYCDARNYERPYPYQEQPGAR